MAPEWVPCPGLSIVPKGFAVGQGMIFGGQGANYDPGGSRETHFNFGGKFKLPLLRKKIPLKLGIKRSQKVTSYTVTTLMYHHLIFGLKSLPD